VVVVNPNTGAAQPASEPGPQEQQPQDSDVMNAPVFTTGALVFAATYGASVITAAASDHPGADRLYVPLAGPWLALADWGHCPVANPGCDSNTTDKVMLVVDGVFQAGSLIGMLDSLVQPSHHAHTVVVADKKVHVTPTGNGFAVFGHF
jgi:hypothetical protein